MKELDETVRPEGETTEEGAKVKGKAIVTGPSREEYEEHMRTHIPYRSWCEFCVKERVSQTIIRKQIRIRKIQWRTV